MSEEVKKQKIKPAAWFLIIITVILLIMFSVRIWWEYNQEAALRIAFSPSHPIAEDTATPAPDYSSNSAWFIRPDVENTAATMFVDGATVRVDAAPVDVFYIHPTSGFKNDRWNAAFDDIEANAFTNSLALKHQLSAFNASTRMYAPKYRQGNFGVFFAENQADTFKALNHAFSDVVRAFDHYLANDNKGRPFIIAGHSQGAIHVMFLLKEHLKDHPAAKNMIAAYAVGWPISVEADLPAMGFPACDGPTMTSCVISWQTFGKGGDTRMMQNYMQNTVALNGQPRAGTTMLCVNPLNWKLNGTESAEKHLGAIELAIDTDPIGPLSDYRFGASCDTDGILMLDRIAVGKTWESHQMPGLNMHSYDVNIFYMNLRENVRDRIDAWLLKKDTPEGVVKIMLRVKE